MEMLHIRKLYFILQSDKLHVGITPKSAGIRHVYMSLTQKEAPPGAKPLRFFYRKHFWLSIRISKLYSPNDRVGFNFAVELNVICAVTSLVSDASWFNFGSTGFVLQERVYMMVSLQTVSTRYYLATRLRRWASEGRQGGPEFGQRLRRHIPTYQTLIVMLHFKVCV